SRKSRKNFGRPAGNSQGMAARDGRQKKAPTAKGRGAPCAGQILPTTNIRELLGREPLWFAEVNRNRVRCGKHNSLKQRAVVQARREYCQSRRCDAVNDRCPYNRCASRQCR